MDAPSENTRRRWTGRRIAVPLCLAAATVTAFLAAQAPSAHARTNGRWVSLTAQSQAQPRGQAQGSQVNAGSGDRGEAFTACLRSHGVKDFPGITIGEDGTIQLKTGGSVNPLSATYKAAAKACASLLPKGSTLPGEPTPPSPSAPTPSFSCGSDCPAPPKVPELRF